MEKKRAKFVRRFAEVRRKWGRGMQYYFGAVHQVVFQTLKWRATYEDGGEWKIFLEQMGDKRWPGLTDSDGVQEITRARVLSASKERRHPSWPKQCEYNAHIRSLRLRNIERGF